MPHLCISMIGSQTLFWAQEVSHTAHGPLHLILSYGYIPLVHLNIPMKHSILLIFIKKKKHEMASVTPPFTCLDGLVR